MGTENNGRLVLTVKEVQKLLGLSRGLVYQAIQSGQIPSIRIGRRVLIPRAALEHILAGTDANDTLLKS